MRYTIAIILSITGLNYTFAQDSRTLGNQSASAVNPRQVYSAQQIDAMRKAIAKHPYTKYYDRLIVEYEKRMKSNVKKYTVMARKMEKPQYSDPSYFGHKHKPKIRAVGKRKYCKECEIVH